MASFPGSFGGRWLDRLALVLALIAMLLNTAIAVQYGWLAGWFPWEAMQDDGTFIAPGDIASATAPFAVVGAL